MHLLGNSVKQDSKPGGRPDPRGSLPWRSASFFCKGLLFQRKKQERIGSVRLGNKTSSKSVVYIVQCCYQCPWKHSWETVLGNDVCIVSTASPLYWYVLLFQGREGIDPSSFHSNSQFSEDSCFACFVECFCDWISAHCAWSGRTSRGLITTVT